MEIILLGSTQFVAGVMGRGGAEGSSRQKMIKTILMQSGKGTFEQKIEWGNFA